MPTALILSPTVSRERMAQDVESARRDERSAAYGDGLGDAFETWESAVRALVQRLPPNVALVVRSAAVAMAAESAAQLPEVRGESQEAGYWRQVCGDLRHREVADLVLRAAKTGGQPDRLTAEMLSAWAEDRS